MLPDFLIIGAPKAATTSLANALRGHPEIHLPEIKEIHFFDEDQYWEKGVDWYESYFETSDPDVTTYGEATTGYLGSERSPERIRRVVPDAKLICVLRDPLRRAYSNYWFSRQFGKFEVSFDDAVERAKNDRESRAYELLLHHGFYATHLARYFEYFSRDQIETILFEELTGSPESTLNEIQKFVGVSPISLELGRDNPTREPRSEVYQWIYNSLLQSRLAKFIKRLLPDRTIRGKVKRFFRRLNMRKKEQKPPMSPRTARCLNELYRSDVIELADMIDEDLNHWLEPPRECKERA